MSIGIPPVRFAAARQVIDTRVAPESSCHTKPTRYDAKKMDVEGETIVIYNNVRAQRVSQVISEAKQQADSTGRPVVMDMSGVLIHIDPNTPEQEIRTEFDTADARPRAPYRPYPDPYEVPEGAHPFIPFEKLFIPYNQIFHGSGGRCC